jgi:hypothetical protein
MRKEDLWRSLDTTFTFSARPFRAPADRRVVWRLATLLLLVDKMRGGQATLKQLHATSWALRTTENQRLLLDALSGVRQPDLPVGRFDPAVNLALDVAVGERLLRRDGDKFLMTAQGKRLLEQIRHDDSILRAEKQFLGRIKGRLTQKDTDLLLW